MNGIKRWVTLLANPTYRSGRCFCLGGRAPIVLVGHRYADAACPALSLLVGTLRFARTTLSLLVGRVPIVLVGGRYADAAHPAKLVFLLNRNG